MYATKGGEYMERIIRQVQFPMQSQPKAKRVVAGRNYFEFIMYDNFIVEPIKYCFGLGECPMSYTGIRTIDTDYCNVNEISYHSGMACAEKIVKDGWKMNY